MSRFIRFLSDPKSLCKALRVAAAVITMVAQVIMIVMG